MLLFFSKLVNQSFFNAGMIEVITKIDTSLRVECGDKLTYTVMITQTKFYSSKPFHTADCQSLVLFIFRHHHHFSQWLMVKFNWNVVKCCWQQHVTWSHTQTLSSLDENNLALALRSDNKISVINIQKSNTYQEVPVYDIVPSSVWLGGGTTHLQEGIWLLHNLSPWQHYTGVEQRERENQQTGKGEWDAGLKYP